MTIKNVGWSHGAPYCHQRSIWQTTSLDNLIQWQQGTNVNQWFGKARTNTALTKPNEGYYFTIWSSRGKRGFIRVQAKHDTILFECAATGHTFSKTQKEVTTAHWMSVLLPTERLARVRLSKQRQGSWCGHSFPLSWPDYRTGVWGSVGKSSVKEKRGSVYLSLLAGHDFTLWSVCRPAPNRLAGVRSHEVTLSPREGLIWDTDKTG